MIRTLIFVLAVFLAVGMLAACGGSEEPSPTETPLPATNSPVSEATKVPDPTETSLPAEPTEAPATATAEPTADAFVSPQPTPTEVEETLPEPVDWREFESQNDEGYFERGNPDAPLLILDFSDFL